jgi:hypothetical protein
VHGKIQREEIENGKNRRKEEKTGESALWKSSSTILQTAKKPTISWKKQGG